ncbi:glucan biosynthesis protein [Novosphingobium beihaiensis]|uniref:Glucan biosynthesis protein D n=1 Tax=Novosphingobium beihaiensis TaxID=2930389 RepID=A0ABT0BWC5_9SPHN|nr:glucan biosynthesis protein D [Novosphingobium beihaiensis]MCJ2189121.1 glucan biosynthesis protein D [Novosphingobium beihaiensis]
MTAIPDPLAPSQTASPATPSGTVPGFPGTLTRREAATLLAAGFGLAALPAPLKAASPRFGTPQPFSWHGLVQQARRLAAAPYAAPEPPPHLAPDFDAFGKLTYGPAEALDGSIRLFPAARRIAEHAVAIHLVADGRARRLLDTTGLFTSGKQADPAGLRVMDEGLASDWLAYLGASYFRTSGSLGQYGLSARGIAVGTGTDEPEEFPAFTAFWLEPLGPGHIRIHALLDGPSLTGAYAFDCRKSAAGVQQDVQASLFFRRDIARLGLAPATSMFWYDQHNRRADWRPEIHDSDGLAIWSGTGERIWRPLENPSAARITTFQADSPKGFGLMQRDEVFDHYQDDGAFYDRRPSLWATPSGDWGPGSVMLYEMPTDGETQDNIVAFWTSDAPARRGGQRDFAYRLNWTSRDLSEGANARCVDMFEGPAGRPGEPPVPGAHKYVFDFAGPVLAGLGRKAGIEAATDLPAEAVLASAAYPVAGMDARWRVMLDVRTTTAPRPEFRLYLKRGDSALSETVIKMIKP